MLIREGFRNPGQGNRPSRGVGYFPFLFSFSAKFSTTNPQLREVGARGYALPIKKKTLKIMLVCFFGDSKEKILVSLSVRQEILFIFLGKSLG